MTREPMPLLSYAEAEVELGERCEVDSSFGRIECGGEFFEREGRVDRGVEGGKFGEG